MKFASSATAIRFTATAGAFREGAAKKPVGGRQLSDPGTEPALGSRELGAVEGVVREVNHLRYLVYLRLRQQSIDKMK